MSKKLLLGLTGHIFMHWLCGYSDLFDVVILRFISINILLSGDKVRRRKDFRFDVLAVEEKK